MVPASAPDLRQVPAPCDLRRTGLAISALSTQTVIESAGQHEYGRNALSLSASGLFGVRWPAIRGPRPLVGDPALVGDSAGPVPRRCGRH